MLQCRIWTVNSCRDYAEQNLFRSPIKWVFNETEYSLPFLHREIREAAIWRNKTKQEAKIPQETFDAYLKSSSSDSQKQITHELWWMLHAFPEFKVQLLWIENCYPIPHHRVRYTDHPSPKAIGSWLSSP